MGEVVDYTGEASGFNTEEERTEFVNLAEDFQNADVQTSEFDGKKSVWFLVSGVRRGGGHSCEEIVEAHFGEWVQSHSHIEITVWATYLEHAPEDRVFSHGGEA